MKILSTIFHTVFIALIIGIAGLVVGTMLPIPGNIEIKIVKSGSMEPAIPTGSLVVVKPAAQYVKGDVITFGKDTKTDIPTTHRIIALNADGSFTVKGDANEDPDTNPVPRNTVIGKVLFHIPGAGYVLDFARTRLGFALLIGIPAALIILEELLTIGRETRKWYRGRGGPGSGSGGMRAKADTLDLRTHLKRVYAKRRHMDEIKVAMYVEPRWYEGLWWRKKLGLDTDAYRTSTSLTVGLVFFVMVFAGHNGTISYFSDIERSLANVLRAGEWDEAPLQKTAEEDAPITPLAAVAAPEGDGEVLGESDTAEDGATDATDPPADDPSADTPSGPEDDPAPEGESAQLPANEPIPPADTPADPPQEPSADPAPEPAVTDDPPPASDPVAE